MSDSPNEDADVAGDAAWSHDLDALVAAPAHHTLVYENDRVRVLDTCIRPGEQTPVHTHRWPAALSIVGWSPFVRYDDQGAVLLDSRSVPALQNPPPALWSEPLGPHSLRNVGTVDLHVISVEVKR